MRPILALTLVCLSGCGWYDNQTHPNDPVSDSENMGRIRGQDADVEPLTTEPGNIWANPEKQKIPTLNDFRKPK
jgi:hypothetical protein